MNQSQNHQQSYYSTEVMGYLQALPNSGALNIDHKSVFMAEVGSLDIGVKIKLYIKINSDIIQEVKYLVYGDSFTIATLGYLSEQLPGLKLSRATNFSFNQAIEQLSIPQTKLNELKIIKTAINNIAEQYIQSKNSIINSIIHGSK
ncbi:MAG: iron-sulfur cluster assembly scaffold protein [Gammaproteobacteria bacterium]|nr:iron-sulfur cluster assembly scaffold protein [Gammaproteobacteria bacterium]